MTFRLKLIDDAKHAWRMWSQRLNALGLLILSYVQFDPVGALSVWNMMPGPAREFLPRQFVLYIGLALIFLAMLSRVVKQPKLEELRNGGK